MPADLTEHDPTHVGDRYAVLALLGRGGMGSVYRVRDGASGEELALKCLTGKRGAAPGASSVELFEREFHTLNQLAHPRVVRAFDYGIDAGRPFYTLELLDGGDLRGQAPMPWQRVCTIAYELCSVLSLLHSRRLVHRDLTPRNVRLTSDGKAKLIDFGLLSPIGPVRMLAGTPPYLAPELVHSMTVDGRADLFALGATLYFALTGGVAYPSRSLTELKDAWRRTPPPVSKFCPEVPAPLERLVSALLRLDLDSRPRSAPEVMDCLRPLLPETPDEELVVARAHLTAPTLVGRATEQTRMRKPLLRSARGRGGGFLITGAPGTGRSRMLDLFLVEAKLLGGITARASGSDSPTEPFGVARTLVAQLRASAPLESLAVARQDPALLRMQYGSDQAPDTDGERDARSPADSLLAEHDAGALQAALRTWILDLSRRRPVALAVDDLESADSASVSLIAALALVGDQGRISYAVSMTGTPLERPAPALTMLVERARRMALAPLDLEQTALLLQSVFGDVPHLQVAARQLRRLSDGRPRECMTLAQHLVDQGIIRHANGTWVLPPMIEADALPASIEEALEQQLARLSPWATEVARLLALSVVGRLSWAELRELVGGPPADLQNALEELRQARLLAGGPEGFVGHAGVPRMLLERCTPEDRAGLHTSLASMHARRDTASLVVAHHLLQGQDPEQGLRLVAGELESESQAVRFMDAGMSTMGRTACAETFYQARAAARRHASPPGDQLRLSLWLEINATHGADLRYFYEVAAELTTTLKRASGFDDWIALSEVADPHARALQALARANSRYEATPVAERVRPPAEAIRWMVGHVLQATAVGARANDLELLAGLPELLEPFVTLNPAVRAARVIAMAHCFVRRGAYEAAHDLQAELQKELATLDPSALTWVHYVRASMRLTEDLMSVVAGLSMNASQGAEDTDVRSLQANVESIRKLAALHRGDWEAAEGHRRNAELLSLQNGASGMLDFIREEWPVHALARDLTGIRAIRERLAPLAQRHPGWVADQLAVEAWYHRLCEQPEPALAAVHGLRKAVAQLAIVPPAFYRGVEVEVALLVETDKPDLALERGLAALAECDADGRRMLGRGLALEVALAEAALGDHKGARARVERELARQVEFGVTGLPLGHSYEYLARVALVSGDSVAFEAAADRCAQEYRVGAGSMLGARHRRLIEEAHRAEIRTGAPVRPGLDAQAEDSGSVARLLSNLSTGLHADALAREGIALLCDAHGAPSGWLYLLSESGLALVASQGEPEDQKALATYAQAQLELEMDDGILTMTPDDWTATEAGASALGENTSPPEANRRWAIPLRTTIDGIDNLIGIAIVTAQPDDVFPSNLCSELASGLAKYLLDSGAYRPVHAS